MSSWLNKQFGLAIEDSQLKLICKGKIWSAGTEQLRQRTRNKLQESGAFLLGKEEDNGVKRILEFIFYDDIDPHALDSGIVHFSGNKLPKLWEICRARGYGIVADVHVHPRAYYQSASDQADPVIPRQGHLAIIIPDFACRATVPGGIGLYEYKGNGSWVTHTHKGLSFFKLD